MRSSLSSFRCLVRPSAMVLPRPTAVSRVITPTGPLTSARSLSTLFPPSRPQCRVPSAFTLSSSSSVTGSSPSLFAAVSNPDLDLAPHPSASPFLAGLQLRHGPRPTMNRWSHLVRKRRCGFLARKRSKTGRRILARRQAKGRRFLSH